MTDLFDRAESDAAKSEALDRVEHHADPEWKALMLELILTVCRTKQRFTIDDVNKLYHEIEADKPTTHEKRALGGLMNSAARLNWCRKTNVTENSARRVCHSRPLSVWESLICEVAE